MLQSDFVCVYVFCEFGGKWEFCLVEVCVSLVTTCYLLEFLYFSEYHEKYTTLGSGQEEKKVSKTELYSTLSIKDNKRVQASWDFNLLVKRKHWKKPF